MSKEHAAIGISGITLIILILSSLMNYSGGYTTHRETDLDMATINQRFDSTDKGLNNIYEKLQRYDDQIASDKQDYQDLSSRYDAMHSDVGSLLDDRARASLERAEQLQIQNVEHRHKKTASIPDP